MRHLLTCGVHLSMSYLFAFSYCSWGSQGKNSEVVCHSLLQWTTFCQTSPPWPVRLGWPHTAWLSFIALGQAVVLWSDWLVICDCGFSLSDLRCPLSGPTVSLGFLLPWTWDIFSRLLQQSAAAARCLGRGVASLGCAPALLQPLLSWENALDSIKRSKDMMPEDEPHQIWSFPECYWGRVEGNY